MKKKIFKTLLMAGLLSLGLASCGKKEDDYKLKIVTPGAAPLLGMSETIKKNESNVDLDNSVLQENPSSLAGHLITGSIDIIVAPVNAGAKLYNANKSSYKLAGILTWGNQYFASRNSTFTIDSLNNNEITLFGEGTVNELEMDIVLEAKNITVSNKSYVVNAKAANTTLTASATAMVLTAEPALTAIKKDYSDVIAYSLNDLYKELTTYDAPQAAVFVNPTSYSEHKALIDDFLADLKKETAEINDDAQNAISAFTSLGGTGVPLAAVVGSHINFKSAKDSKAALQFLVSKDIEKGTNIFVKQMNDEFYM